ncbi:MAG: GH39, partial [uncultured Solirubrobacterales bacterium]
GAQTRLDLAIARASARRPDVIKDAAAARRAARRRGPARARGLECLGGGASALRVRGNSGLAQTNRLAVEPTRGREHPQLPRSARLERSRAQAADRLHALRVQAARVRLDPLRPPVRGSRSAEDPHPALPPRVSPLGDGGSPLGSGPLSAGVRRLEAPGVLRLRQGGFRALRREGSVLAGQPGASPSPGAPLADLERAEPPELLVARAQRQEGGQGVRRAPEGDELAGEGRRFVGADSHRGHDHLDHRLAPSAGVPPRAVLRDGRLVLRRLRRPASLRPQSRCPARERALGSTGAEPDIGARASSVADRDGLVGGRALQQVPGPRARASKGAGELSANHLPPALRDGEELRGPRCRLVQPGGLRAPPTHERQVVSPHRPVRSPRRAEGLVEGHEVRDGRGNMPVL